ncbi:MAG: IS66 family transposase [Bacilli bacterium]|nr:IS66 family transposase [Bacilli bacterium]
MIDLRNIKHVYVACGYTDLRKGIDGYIYLADGKLKIDPFTNVIFIFCNKFKNKIKILHYESGSFWLYYKRIEHYTIKWPVASTGIEITKSQVDALLTGLRLENYIKKWLKSNFTFSRKYGNIYNIKEHIYMENLEFKSQIAERLKKYQSLNSPEEKEIYFKNLMIEFEDVEIQKYILEEKQRLEKMRKYGRKTEKLTDGTYIQLALFDENSDVFNEAEEIASNSAPEPEYETITYRRKKRQNKVNMNNQNLITVIIDHKLKNAHCDKCGSVLQEITYKEIRTYDFIPARLVLNVHREHSYKCNTCSSPDKNVIINVKRKTSFPKLMAEDSFISHIIVEKYLKHVPLYRQEKVFNNMGLDVTRKNFSNWIIKAANVLSPLYLLLYQNIIKSDICHMDETPLRVIEADQKNAYMWGLCSSKYDNPAYIYVYEPNRRHHHASDLLKGFKGYLHSDGYEAYRGINGVTNVACFAHARRKYVEILKVTPHNSSFYNLAETGKNYIDRLYKIEKQIVNLSIDERYKIRQEKSLPIINEYENWLNSNIYVNHKQFAITKAINYSLNGMKELRGYLLDGRLDIDNNRCERMMKNFVIGRKNFLFCFSESGADASAVLYSIIET